MTFSITDALESARRLQERQRRIELLQARQVRLEISISSGQLMSANSLQQIEMHITPWWYDENGIPTRQIWAKGSVIER